MLGHSFATGDLSQKLDLPGKSLSIFRSQFGKPFGGDHLKEESSIQHNDDSVNIKDSTHQPDQVINDSLFQYESREESGEDLDEDKHIHAAFDADNSRRLIKRKQLPNIIQSPRGLGEIEEK